MPPIRLLIVEDNTLQRELYIATLEPWPEIQVISAVSNGMDALQSIQQLQPDVVLFDVVMPQMDGFGLLDRINRMDAALRPSMIALTSLGRDDFVARAVNLGVDDYLIKPVDPEQLAQRIIVQHQLRQSRQTPAAPVTRPAALPLSPDPISDALTDEPLRKYTAVLLMQLGLPAHLNGYRYLTEAIIAVIQSPQLVNRVTTALYPAIAASCGTTPSRVERSIRNAVSITWDRGGGTALNKILGRTTARPADKPSNSELIAQLAARIRVKEGR